MYTIGRRIILKWILERQDGVVLTGLIWLRIGTSEGSYEHGNDPSGSIKCWAAAQLGASQERLSSMESVIFCLQIQPYSGLQAPVHTPLPLVRLSFR
jgi:hypothetical protein